MDWERIRNQLAQALGAEVRLTTVREWEDDGDNGIAVSSEQGASAYFLDKTPNGHLILQIDKTLTVEERELIKLLVQVAKGSPKDVKGKGALTEEQQHAAALREWMRDQLEKGAAEERMPESLAAWKPLMEEKIPFLLLGDDSGKSFSYNGLKKLLETFFDSEVLLIPLSDRECMILAPESIVGVGDLEDKNGNGYETLEESLHSLGSGLYEMMVTEWTGDCRLAVAYPIVPAKALLQTAAVLRETIALGKQYHIGSNVHLPWTLHLERLLQSIPGSEKSDFMQRILKRTDYFTDAEMLSTLEQFFILDCNVSETAKKLYIHRNTLLYRLDKFKQETGLDVRSFKDAVLVKIALLLYKVTKRK